LNAHFSAGAQKLEHQGVIVYVLPAPYAIAWAGNVIVCRLSVCLSVTLMYADHISWATSNFIRLYTNNSSLLFADLHRSRAGGTPSNVG